MSHYTVTQYHDQRHTKLQGLTSYQDSQTLRSLSLSENQANCLFIRWWIYQSKGCMIETIMNYDIINTSPI
jgi:hypothetical protein